MDQETQKNSRNIEPRSIEPISAPVRKDSRRLDHIVLHNLECVDSNGRVFEQYDTLYIDTDIMRGEGGRPILLSPYSAIRATEETGKFVPSFALSCNILARLYEQDENPATQSIFQQYKNFGLGLGVHLQNTVVYSLGGRIIHYPQANDFLADMGSAIFRESGQINHSRKPIELPFSTRSKDYCNLYEALMDKRTYKFLQNLTGLKDPRILTSICNDLGRQGVFFLQQMPFPTETWLGSSYINFLVNSGDNFTGNVGAVRTVWPIPRNKEYS